VKLVTHQYLLAKLSIFGASKCEHFGTSVKIFRFVRLYALTFIL